MYLIPSRYPIILVADVMLSSRTVVLLRPVTQITMRGHCISQDTDEAFIMHMSCFFWEKRKIDSVEHGPWSIKNLDVIVRNPRAECIPKARDPKFVAP